MPEMPDAGDVMLVGRFDDFIVARQATGPDHGGSAAQATAHSVHEPFAYSGFRLRQLLHPELESSGHLSCFGIRLRIMKLRQLVNLSPPAIRAQHGKFSRQMRFVRHGNFARTCGTTHARVGLADFLGSCHDACFSRAYEDRSVDRSIISMRRPSLSSICPSRYAVNSAA
jgi:hypothetical protein